jgi:hypothetical protein
MIIEQRDSSLKYPLAIKDEKIRLVLDWLLEFRFSSLDILSARLGQSTVNSNRFFNALLDSGIIQAFKNVHTKNQRYVILTSAGVSYLEAMGRDISIATTRVANLGRYSQIVHDLSVQISVLNRLDRYSEVIWDRNITFGTQHDKPDAVLKLAENGAVFWSALEFERWRKDRKRIYITFYNHAQHIADKHYTGVYYVFQLEADCKYYQGLFNEEKWPRFERKTKTGQFNALKTDFVPESIPDIRKRFVFLYEPVSI